MAESPYSRELVATSTWRPQPTERQQHARPRLGNCAQCGKQNPPPGTRSAAIDRYDPQGLFCSLRCAASYGVDTLQKQLAQTGPPLR